MEMTTVEPVKARARMPKAAIALLTIVGLLLLVQLGVVIQRAWADTGGGSASISVTPDTASDQVAATAAEFRVDESGAATYSVPLYTVPGTAGVAPQLSLSYSSQGGYGPVGMGWSIGGLSSVSRCRATRENGDFIVAGVATDGTPQPINFTASDRYCLDGQRLVPAQSGTATCPSIAGMGVENLRTEIESFQRVCAYTPTSGTNGPAFFTVDRKDGSKSWYGDRAADTTDLVDGYFNATTPGKESAALAWAQTRFQDSTGNYIDYLYSEKPAGGTAGEQLLSEVRYTGKKVLSGQTGSAIAPYAKVTFNYSARTTGEWEYRYTSGGQYVQTRKLDSITVCATITCATADQARYYVMTYGTTVSNSARQILTSLKECRDSTQGVCMPPTTFEWSQATNNFVTYEEPAVTLGNWNSPYEGHKFGDVDGDGRLDIVYLLDGSSGHPCSTEYAKVGFSRLDAQNRLNLVGSTRYVCTPAELMTGRGEGSWHLLDYNGDGRDDLFVSGPTGSGWRIYPSVGDSGNNFNASINLLAGLSPAIPSVEGKTDQVQLTDLNGDALIDIIYPSGGTLKARLMERTGSTFGWGAERTVDFDWASFEPLDCPPNAIDCWRSMDGTPVTKTGFTHMADFNGDAAADLLIGETHWSIVMTGGPSCDLYRTSGQSKSAAPVGYMQEGDRPDVKAADTSKEKSSDTTPSQQRPPDCIEETIGTRYMDAVAVSSITATTVTYASKARLPYPYELNLGDVNADGLTDIFYRTYSSGDWLCLVNTGNGFGPNCNVGTIPNADKSQFVDINGDGRTDVVYPASSGNVFNVKYALPSGGWGFAVQPGSGAFTCVGVCGSTWYINLFADLDGDGAVDHASIRPGDTPNIFVSRTNAASSQFKPRDTITAIVNGLGARTELTYASLTNNAVYRRDTGSRNATNWGRGAAVQDLLAPMYVVAKASSSAPQDGNPAAMANLHYRYAGAKVQAGGRGYLGFREIVTFDPNQTGGYVGTATTYNQNFPFVGMPARTLKAVFSGQSYTPSSCLTSVTNACYSVPGQFFAALGGNWFADSSQLWEADTDNTAGASAFAAGVQAPLHVRTLGSDEQARDPFSSTVTSRVATSFGYGAYGNVGSTTVDTYTGASTLTGTVMTANTYADDVVAWRLGRLSYSSVTHQRPGKTNVVKTASFAYDLDPNGPKTGQLTQETTQPTGAADQKLLKAYALDAFGNRLRSSTCSTDIASCGTTAVNFQPTTKTSINRYARVVYDGNGRFPLTTYEPFWSGSATIERVTQTVVSRNVFGEVTQAYDLNGTDSVAVAGTFGRPYYSWVETVPGSVPGSAGGGISSTSSYRWCGSGGVDCPNGAKFRQTTTADGAPTQWAYFDLLGRPILKAALTFNVGVSGKDVSAACTTYDATGKPKRASNPFFLAGVAAVSGPTGLASVCTDAARTWTSTTYDLLGRPTRVDAPDSTYSTLSYNGNQTIATDPRFNATVQVRNGAGELLTVTDAAGMVMTNDYTADGNQSAVTRDAGRGAIQNLFTYDVRGRKTQQNDPDSGVTSLEYNALGELIAQQDATGNRIEMELDARGRTWRKTVKRANATIETQSTFVFDTATNGVGQLTSETVTGTYTGWVGQSNVAQSYSRGYGYDLLGRNTSVSSVIDGVSYAQNNALDALGRVYKHQDASGGWQKTEFSVRGYSAALCISDGVDTAAACPALAWQRTELTDNFGNIVSEKRASGGQIPITRNYNPLNGRQTGLCAGATNCNLVNELYAWDNAGNLSTQQKEGRYAETFYYDNLNRLTNSYLTMVDGVAVNNTLVQWAQYDGLGNTCARLFNGQGVGMGYAGRAGCGATVANGSGTSGYVGAHQLTTAYHNNGWWTYQWDGRGNQTVRDAPGTANDRTILYSLDDHAHEISTGNGLRTRYWYGPDGQRYKREDANGLKTLYIGQVEVLIQGGTTYRRNIAGVLIKTEGAVPADNRFIFTDRLGSVVKYTSGNGATTYQPQDFDEWGARRDYDEPTLAGTTPTPTIALRGFTGHEMVDGQDVINMNARMYDPTLGRFLQADPLIQAPDNVQSWNAYTYVFNNPLTMTDPTGMSAWRQALGIVFAAVYAYFTWDLTGASAVYAAMIGGAISGAIATGTWRGALTGAFTGALTAGVGVAAQAYEWGDLARISAQAVSGGIVESIQGGNFGNGFLAAGLTAAVMPLAAKGNAGVRAVKGALIGGTISEVTGGKFANGAVSGAIQGAMMGAKRKRGGLNAESGASGKGDPTEGAPPELAAEIRDPAKREKFLNDLAKKGWKAMSGKIKYMDIYSPDDLTALASTLSANEIIFWKKAFEYDYATILSTMDHEYEHMWQFMFKGKIEGKAEYNSRELAAYDYQMALPNFKAMSKTYQDGFIRSRQSYSDILFALCKNEDCSGLYGGH